MSGRLIGHFFFFGKILRECWGTPSFLFAMKFPNNQRVTLHTTGKIRAPLRFIIAVFVCLNLIMSVLHVKWKAHIHFKSKIQLSIKTGKVTSPRMLVAKIIWRGVFDNRKKWCLGIHSATNDPPFPSSSELGFYTIERAHSYCGAIQPRIICCASTVPTVGVTPNKIAIKIVIFVYFRTVLLISTNTGQWKMENFHIQNIRISRR